MIFWRKKILFGLPNSMGTTSCAPGGVGEGRGGGGEIVKKVFPGFTSENWVQKSITGFRCETFGGPRISRGNIWGSPDFTWKHKGVPGFHVETRVQHPDFTWKHKTSQNKFFPKLVKNLQNDAYVRLPGFTT